ncbi:MAG: glycosyltransferase family 2 protein [Candidatus Omnitrophica bacterium]|jgi:hypothetical protein|nr:glycosyltransferase family 2 protein [Candidatus Omnitrophota bacterium]
MYDIICSIVVYKTEGAQLKKAVQSFLNSSLNLKLYIIDNSPSDKLRDILVDFNAEYIFNNKNLGFGAAHNIAIRNSAGLSKYHLVLNPDISFESGVLEAIFNFMEKNINVGLLMPKVCYPDGSIQYLCKLLPNPLDLFLRRSNIAIVNRLFRKSLENYELRFTGYRMIMDVPCLSGCFMFLRREILAKVGIFDQRFFMYLEDVDFSRRIHKHYRTVFYPQVSVIHHYSRGSYSNYYLFWCHIVSAVKYFFKWGWFFDQERKLVNRRAMDKLS